MCSKQHLKLLEENSKLCAKYQPNGDPTSVGEDLVLYDCKAPEDGKCPGNDYTPCFGNDYFKQPESERCMKDCPCGFDYKKFEDRCGKWASKKCAKKKNKGHCTKKKVQRRCGHTCYSEVERMLLCKSLKKAKDRKGMSCGRG